MMANDDMRNRVELVFESIRPSIEMHGGDIEFVQFEQGILSIRFLGACVGCPASSFTLKLGIEEAIKAHMPDVIEVVAVD
jgi:Fe-S cluster biogenesis protein NfuA